MAMIDASNMMKVCMRDKRHTVSVRISKRAILTDPQYLH
jgi:hypothetical protein